MKTNIAMKCTHAILAAVTLLAGLFVSNSAQAQRALTQGDTITVSYTRTSTFGTKTTYYVSRDGSTSNIKSTQTPDKNCLWVIFKMTPITKSGNQNDITVQVYNLAAHDAGQAAYLKMTAAKNGTLSLQASETNATVLYTIRSQYEVGESVDANVIAKNGKTNYYLNWNNSWAASNTNSPQTMHIQKWSKRTTSVAEPTFYPGHAIFGWAGNESEAAAQTISIICDLNLISRSYFYNVSNENQQIVDQAAHEVTPDASPTPTLTWEHAGMDHKMEIQNETYNNTDKEFTFDLAPIGASPVVTDQAEFNDIMDNIVCTAYYGGKPISAAMPCERRVFLRKELNPLSFTVTHASYSFPVEGGGITLIPTLIYKPGTEWINTDGIVEHADYPAPDYRVEYEDPGLMVTTEVNAPWLTFNGYGPWEINLTAERNSNNADRSAQVIVTVLYGVYEPIGDDPGYSGTHYSLQHDDKKKDQQGVYTDVYKEDPSGTYKRVAYDEFIRQVTLSQAGTLHGADIQFDYQVGRGGNAGEYDSHGYQKVHTNKKVLYYVPGNGSTYGSDVELRLTESAFFGYRRWYNFDTGHGIQNSVEDHQNTIWSNAPHIEVTSGRSTTSINYTPINTDTEHSRGVFAVNGSNNSGYKILRNGMTDPAPIIKGYKTATGGPNNDGVHTIACDLSAFTDYTLTESAGKLTDLIEPTLSYRQLFELHPASEIADKIRDLADGKYLEEYEYTAPVGSDVHLSTSQRYRSKRYHNSEMGYYFYTNENNATNGYSQIGVTSGTTSVVWKKDNAPFTPTYSANTDNVIVSERSAGKHIYTLEAGGKRIAKFTVTYMAKTQVGPSAAALITEDELKNKYVKLAEINFNEGAKPGNTDNVISMNHLDWEDATFGFAYQRDAVIGGTGSTGSQKNTRPSNKDLCYYGEYLLVNRWNKTSSYGWMDPKVENRGGKANGYMLFADGTMEPSMVASIQTDAQICSGQQMFCSAWIANACPAGYGTGANPIFRFNVQGRNSDSEEWEDVSVFFAGDLPKGSGWQQINFPIHANAQSFSQTRVCVYNFATTNSGNDFFLDDIELYATPLPLSAYQASTSCAGSDIAVVVKVDYKNVDRDLEDRDVYYQGWIEIENPHSPGDTILIAIPNLADYGGQYMWGDELKPGTTQTVGKLTIPAKDYNPKTSAPGKIYHSVQEFIDHLTDTGTRAGIFYIEQDDHTYSMYVAHLLQGRDGGQYEVRMATQEADLNEPLCAMRVRLPIYKETKITYGQNNNDLTAPVVDACPNVDDVIRVTVTNQISGETEVVTGRADWLIGYAFDSVYAPIDYCASRYGLSGDALTAARVNADTLFRRKYGYTREDVTTAIVYDLRREPYENHPNPNYDVSDPALLDSMAFFTLNDYHIVKSLCDKGLLDMNVGSRTVMLNPGDSIFLWVYPIVGSAEDSHGNKLAVCNQPQWVDFRAPKGSDDQQIMNLSPIANKDKTPAEKLMVGSIRVSAATVNTSFSMPLNDIQNAVFGWDSLRVIDTNDPDVKALLDDEKNFHMRYYTDKVYQGTNGVKVYLADGTPNPDYHSNTKDGLYDKDTKPSGWRYYQAGDIITFRPIDATYVEYLQDRREKSRDVAGAVFSPYSESDANWITKTTAEHTGPQPGFQIPNSAGATMKANYTYHLKTNLLTNSFAGENGGAKKDGCLYGVAFFDVVVIPDLLIWRPQVNNDWGDDNNWHAIINGVEQDHGFAPNADASVIIPVLDNPLLYPAVTGAYLYPMAAGYTPTACKNIYLEAGAHILGQEKLTYEKAYVDMPILTNDWNLISAPLQDMYSGDFYVPHTGDYMSYTNAENEVYTLDSYGKVNSVRPDWASNTMRGTERSADAAYITYTEFFNSNVQVFHHNLDDGTHSTSSLGFSPSNALDNQIAPGQGVSVLSFGPADKPDYTPYALRLPKTETSYSYYIDGSATEYHTQTLTRSNANKFAFTLDGGSTTDMTIHLTNQTSSDRYLLGNPTMAYIDLVDFYDTNKEELTGTVYFLSEAQWKPIVLSLDQYVHFLAPMEAILVEAKTAGTSLNLTLKAEHLTLNNHSYVQGAPARAPEPASAPRRAAANDEPVELLTMTAFTDDAQGVACVGKKYGTSLRYLPGEDACFISSGVEATDDVITPMNLYTVRDSSTMMVDVRPALSRIPLGFVIASNVRNSNDSINLCFNTNEYWHSEVYFVDELTGEQTRIYDGTIITIATPSNHEQRYYLLGMDTEEEEYQVPTGWEGYDPSYDPNAADEILLAPVEKFEHNGVIYIRKAGRTYTILGREVK